MAGCSEICKARGEHREEVGGRRRGTFSVCSGRLGWNQNVAWRSLKLRRNRQP